MPDKMFGVDRDGRRWRRPRDVKIAGILLRPKSPKSVKESVELTLSTIRVL